MLTHFYQSISRCEALWKYSVFFLLLFATAIHADTVYNSGPRQVALLELYTSQGCSSCPPADRWLSELKNRSDLWDNFVPLALHVDYWDYIGWQDPFAQPDFGQRQRRYEDDGQVDAIYTPGMMLDGQEWRGWAKGEYPASSEINAGILTLSLGKEDIQVTYSSPSMTADELTAHVVILGFDLKSMVTRGENRGRELANDFIVLQMVDVPLQRDAEEFSAIIPSFTTGPVLSRLAIAAWIEAPLQQLPLQAVGGWYKKD
jgi:hypothetical protein